MEITNYEVHRNAMAESKGKFHICAVMGNLVESEELARHRGTFPTRKAAEERAAELRSRL